MKSLDQIRADEAALAKRRKPDSEAASIRRLKARISRIFIDEVTTYDRINAAIDAWRKAEAKRGGR